MLNPDTLPADFWQGAAQFNRGRFYDCHDTLEALWMEAVEPQRSFFQGILQISVALYHLSNHNWRGATILLGEGIHRLHRFEPDYGGVGVTAVIDQAAAWLAALQRLGPDRAADLAANLAAGLAGDVPAAADGSEAAALAALPEAAVPSRPALAKIPVPKIQRVAEARPVEE